MFDVAGPGQPLGLGADQADEPVDGGLAGVLVGPPIGQRSHTRSKAVGVGVGILGDDGPHAVVVIQGDAKADRGAEVEHVEGVVVDAEGVDRLGGDRGQLVERRCAR